MRNFRKSTRSFEVLELPKNLVRPAGKELDVMGQLMGREEERVQYFLERGAALAALREEMEKAEQAAAIGGGGGKDAPNLEAEDQKADAEYLAAVLLPPA